MITDLGSGDSQTNGVYRLFVVATSSLAAILLGVLSWEANKLISKVDEITSFVASSGERMNSHDYRLGKAETSISDLQQRLSRTEGFDARGGNR